VAGAAPGTSLAPSMRRPFRIAPGTRRVVLRPAVLGRVPRALGAVAPVLAVLVLVLLASHGVSPPLTSASLRTGCEMAQNHASSFDVEWRVTPAWALGFAPGIQAGYRVQPS